MTSAEKLMHKLWGKAREAPNYDKEEWKALQNLLELGSDAPPKATECLTNDELFVALSQRFDVFVAAGERQMENNKVMRYRNTRGHNMSCIGLGLYISTHVNRTINQDDRTYKNDNEAIRSEGL